MTADNSTRKIFYTYAHYRADRLDQGPFYIGKGQGRRPYKLSSRNIHWQRVVKKHGLHVEILGQWATEEDAHSHEILLIDCFSELKTGITNMTIGGEGMTKPDPAVRERIAQVTREAWRDPERRKRMLEGRSTLEAKARKSESLKQAFSAPGSRERRSAAIKAAHAKPDVKARREAIAKDPEYRARMSEALKAARARPEVKAKHEAANAAKRAKTEARKASIKKMTKAEVGQIAGAANRARADARRALLPEAERLRLEKQAASRLEHKNRQRAQKMSGSQTASSTATAET